MKNADHNRRLNNIEIVQASRILDDVLIKEEAGYRYKPGWTDGKVAKAMKATRANIQYLRGKVYGPLIEKPKRAKAAPNKEVLAKLADLESRIAYLERELGIES